jgi:hypothetical protein
MRAGSAVRNRSEIATIATPRGPVDVLRQEMKGLQQRGSWTWFWLARRTGQTDWCQATTAREAIRKATLLPSRKPPAWLREAAATADAQLGRPASET